MDASILDALQTARRAKRPVALATNLRSGAQKLIFKDEAVGPLCLDVDMILGARATNPARCKPGPVPSSYRFITRRRV
jgi:hypothetical protein